LRSITRTMALTIGAAVCSLTLIACSSGATGNDKTTFRLSHQWAAATEGKQGDFRAELADNFSKEVEERTNGAVDITQYPNASLVGAEEQFDALKSGTIDLSVFPLSYASGKVPAFDITMMPGLVRNHQQARSWPDSEAGKEVEELAEENGLKILTWVWNSGAFATKGDPIVSPDDVRPGMVMRGAGHATEEVLADAGAGITSMSSSDIYSALQTGVLDGVTTSASSVISFSLAEQIDSYTAPTQNTMWFIMQPLVISLDAWSKLSNEEKKTLEEVGKELEGPTAEASEASDRDASKVLKDEGVDVVEMDDKSFEQWKSLSEEAAWKSFANDVGDGQRLLDLGAEVSED
jgi:TRAP-type C4-dicarboxylate transport system substrate-binding protein